MNKSRLVAFLLWLFLGTLGIHRFYAGKILSGIVLLLLTGFSALTFYLGIGWLVGSIVIIWLIIDLFLILTGKIFD
ncbi:TM2 domain-containing protein [Candidatus Hepatincolaceae symbiont of Richtersius coronifer]